MRIIDLLNKMAKGEKINKFKYYGGTYIYDKETQKYWYEDMWFDLDFSNLNDEVEIIEEDKKIDRIYHCCHEPSSEETKFLIANINILVDKINELKDIINEMRDK